jgi:hypothetical protein
VTRIALDSMLTMAPQERPWGRAQRRGTWRAAREVLVSGRFERRPTASTMAWAHRRAARAAPSPPATRHLREGEADAHIGVPMHG